MDSRGWFFQVYFLLTDVFPADNQPPSLLLLDHRMSWTEILRRPPQLPLHQPSPGTASILVAAAHHGAHCYGVEIDPRVLRGRTPGVNVYSAPRRPPGGVAQSAGGVRLSDPRVKAPAMR